MAVGRRAAPSPAGPLRAAASRWRRPVLRGVRELGARRCARAAARPHALERAPSPPRPAAPAAPRAAQNIHVGGGRATGLQLPGDLAVPFRCVMPIGAGFAVAALQSRGFAPGLKFLTRAIEGVVDDSKNATLPQDYGQVGARMGPQGRAGGGGPLEGGAQSVRRTCLRAPEQGGGAVGLKPGARAPESAAEGLGRLKDGRLWPPAPRLSSAPPARRPLDTRLSPGLPKGRGLGHHPRQRRVPRARGAQR
jgi:hypothetical protein